MTIALEASVESANWQFETNAEWHQRLLRKVTQTLEPGPGEMLPDCHHCGSPRMNTIPGMIPRNLRSCGSCGAMDCRPGAFKDK